MAAGISSLAQSIVAGMNQAELHKQETAQLTAQFGALRRAGIVTDDDETMFVKGGLNKKREMAGMGAMALQMLNTQNTQNVQQQQLAMEAQRMAQTGNYQNGQLAMDQQRLDQQRLYQAASEGLEREKMAASKFQPSAELATQMLGLGKVYAPQSNNGGSWVDSTNVSNEPLDTKLVNGVLFYRTKTGYHPASGYVDPETGLKPGTVLDPARQVGKDMQDQALAAKRKTAGQPQAVLPTPPATANTPGKPSVGQVASQNGKNYKFDGTNWIPQ